MVGCGWKGGKQVKKFLKGIPKGIPFLFFLLLCCSITRGKILDDWGGAGCYAIA
jgi:hypothetical protein